jgi:hypothetical protein
MKKLIGMFNGGIRAMDLTATNGSGEKSWADRLLPTDIQTRFDTPGYGWQGRGIAWEYVVQLANDSKCDLWICIPMQADDDYITNLFKLIRDGSTVGGKVYPGLNPNLNLYIENSNEIWNTSSAFKQSFQNWEAAKAEVAAGNSPLNWDGETGDWQWAFRRIGARLFKICKIASQVFGANQYLKRIRPVLCWQQGNGQGTASNAMGMFEYLAAKEGKKVKDFLFGCGGSFYFNPDNQSTSLNLDNIWTSQTFDVNNWAKVREVEAWFYLGHGLIYTGYEGGASMDRGGSDDIKAKAWSDPRLTQLEIDHQFLLANFGGGVFMRFFSGGGFEFGHTNDPTVLDTPKLNAVKAFLSKTAKPSANIPTLGDTVPGSFLASHALYQNDYDKREKNADKLPYLRPGFTGVWALRASAAGNYNLVIGYDGDNPNNRIEILINGDLVSSYSLPPTSGWGTPVDSQSFTIPLREGLNGLKIKMLAGDTNFYTFKVTKA